MTDETEHQEDAQKRPPSLYVVATPIGNLSDITLRALRVLKEVDTIAAEDTRTTAHLLSHHGITTPLMALHEHNERRAAQQLLRLLGRGLAVAMVSDAGTPAVADPGARTVALVRDAGYAVVPVPGPNAAVTAFSAAGIVTDHFLFYGFLPAQAAARRRELEALKSLAYAIVFYEAPHRLLASVQDIAAALGAQRRIVIARELTKLFETIHGCELGAAAAWLAEDANRVKGELVLVVEGAPAAADDGAAARRTLEIMLRELPLNQAVKLAAEITGARRNELYRTALDIKGR